MKLLDFQLAAPTLKSGIEGAGFSQCSRPSVILSALIINFTAIGLPYLPKSSTMKQTADIGKACAYAETNG